MARTLDEKDIALLMKLAPELEDIVCEHAQMPFKSILPPLSNHIAPDAKDFERRVRTLTDEELTYLVDMILEGLESLSCVPPEHAEAIISLVAERISKEAAEKIMTVYLEMACYE
jgi:hypothetical protein